MALAVLFTPNRFPKLKKERTSDKGKAELRDKTAFKLMFSYSICEGVGAIKLLNNMCRYQKKLRKNIFSLVWNFDHENFSSSHLWYQAKKIHYLDISLLAAGPLITVSLSLDGI